MPDLNSVPPSSHSLAAMSRRQSSQQMAPLVQPPLSSASSSSINILPSNQSALSQPHAQGHDSRSASLSQPPGASSTASPQFIAVQPMQSQQPPPSSGDPSVGPGPGPLRHPRPLTASELHMQLEKEQEAVVGGSQLIHSPPGPKNPRDWPRLTWILFNSFLSLVGEPIDSRTQPPPSCPKRVRRVQCFVHVGLGLCSRPHHRVVPALRLRLYDSHVAKTSPKFVFDITESRAAAGLVI